MSGYPIKLADLSFEAMIYSARRRVESMARATPDLKAQYELIENRINRAYPVVGVETVRFPHTHLTALLDVVGLALHTMNKHEGVRYPWTPCPQRHGLMKQKRALVKHLTSDVVTRMAALTK
jgi:hypothetical protein